MNDVAVAPSVRLSEGETVLVGLLRAAGRDEAAGALETRGLPTRRVEAYHFTDLKVLLRQVPDRVAAPARDAPPAPAIAGTIGIRLVNGRLAGFDRLGPGIEILAVEAGPAPTDAVPDIALAALTPERTRLRLLKDPTAPLHIDIRTEGAACVSPARIELELAAGVSATVLTTISGTAAAHLAGLVLEAKLNRGAALTHVHVDRLHPSGRQIGRLAYVLGDDAQLRTLAVNRAAALSRLDVAARFDGAGAHADFTGLNLSAGDQHHDLTLNVSHAVPGTSSKELFKSIVRDRAKAVFQGKIVVERGAQKTDARMMAQGLMMSDGAEIMTKPELEIFADDVVCGHGATAGALDTGLKFYLMSRGIPEKEAEALLIQAFIGEAIEEIAHDGIRDALMFAALKWLGVRG